MVVTITSFWKIFCYGVKRHHYEKLIGIKELSGPDLDCFNNSFSTDTGTPSKNIPPLDEVNDVEIVYTCRELHFSSSSSRSTEVSTIYDLTLNSASFSAYYSVASSIRYQRTD